MAELQLTADLSQHSYVFALPCHDGRLQCETALGLLEASAALTSMKVRHRTSIVKGNSLLAAARNQLVRNFLASDFDTLVFIDSDIGFGWPALLRLLIYSHHHALVSGAYPGKEEPPRFYLSIQLGETWRASHSSWVCCARFRRSMD